MDLPKFSTIRPGQDCRTHGQSCYANVANRDQPPGHEERIRALAATVQAELVRLKLKKPEDA